MGYGRLFVRPGMLFGFSRRRRPIFFKSTIAMLVRQ
jgi:hypothetical protein